ncbi:MAG: PilZ domain-containing protein [Acidiferrobacterales bacterium]
MNAKPDNIGGRLSLDALVVPNGDYLREIAANGLVFASRRALESGAVINLRIPAELPAIETTGRVTWSTPEDDHFIVGVEFTHRIDRFRARMIWQVYRIEHYRETVLKREGRELTRQEAAIEWIKRYAPDFPKLDDFTNQ